MHAMTVNGAISKAVAESGFAIFLPLSPEPPGNLIISKRTVCDRKQLEIRRCVRACFLRPWRLQCNGTIQHQVQPDRSRKASALWQVKNDQTECLALSTPLETLNLYRLWQAPALWRCRNPSARYLSLRRQRAARGEEADGML